MKARTKKPKKPNFVTGDRVLVCFPADYAVEPSKAGQCFEGCVIGKSEVALWVKLDCETLGRGIFKPHSFGIYLVAKITEV